MMNPFLVRPKMSPQKTDHNSSEECAVCGACFSCGSWMDCAVRRCDDQLEHAFIEDGELAFQRNGGERVLSFSQFVGSC